MTMQAFEKDRHLHIDLGDGSLFIVPPIPGRIGRTLLGLLIKVSFGTDLAHAEEDALSLSEQALGSSLPGWEAREAQYEDLRSSEQTRISQAAIVWNVQGGSIDAVHDLLNTEAGEAYPKALARVMQSCGLATPFAQLQTWLSGASASPTRAESTDHMSGPIGTSNTNSSETSEAAPTL